MPRVRLRSGETLDWVEWVDEPRHVLVFENAHTRIYSARFDAGQACETLFHKHNEDTVYACISSEGPGGTVLNTEVTLDATTGEPQGLEPPSPVSFTSGLCFCHLNKSKARIHRIQTAAGNTGTLWFIGAEVLAPPPVLTAAPLPEHPCYQREQLDHPKARAYRVSVPPGGSTGPVSWGFSGVVMVLAGAPAAAAFAGRHAGSGGGSNAGEVAAVGESWWFDGPVDAVDVRSSDGAAAELLVVEWC